MKLFEIEMKAKNVSNIIAFTEENNAKGQRFFEKNNFKRSLTMYDKKLH